MTPLILDTSALIAWLKREAGTDFISEALDQHRVLISIMTLLEFLMWANEQGTPQEELSGHLTGAGLQAIPFDGDQAYLSAEFASLFPALNLAERAAFALAKQFKGTVITTNPVHKQLEAEGMNVEVIY